MKVKWTVEEKRRGREMSKEREGQYATIAGILNKEFHGGVGVRSAKAVKARRFTGISTPPVPTKAIEAIRPLAAKGLSAAQIAKELGVTRNTIIGRCSRASIPLQAQGGRPPSTALGLAGPDTPEPLSLPTPTRASHCQYPIGDPKEPGFHFCGQPKAQGSYCQEHFELCHNTQAQRLGWR